MPEIAELSRSVQKLKEKVKKISPSRMTLQAKVEELEEENAALRESMR